MVRPMNEGNSTGLWVLILVILVTALSACDETERSEPYQVTELRVLAIRAEPAEATDDSPVLFDALVVEGSGALTYAWRLCPFAGPAELGFLCLSDEIPEEQLSQIPDELKPCVLGETADTESFTVTPCPYETYALFLGGAAEEGGFPLELDPETGLEMLVSLTVRDETGREVEAVKSFSVTKSESPNQNPSLTGIVVQEEEEQEPEKGEVWAQDQTLVISLEEAPILQVTYDEAIAETVTDPKADPEEAAEPEVEDLLFTWYATSGVFERGRTAPDLMDNEYRPDGDEASDLDSVWVVVRDGRGGMGWIERHFTVTGEN
jgi:hypothetical protein